MKSLLIFLMLLLCTFLSAQTLTVSNIDSIIKENYVLEESDSSSWDILYDSVFMVVSVLDSRIKVAVYIEDLNKVSKKEMVKMLSSHAYNSYDVKYAVYNKKVWVIFDHRLYGLYGAYLIDAIKQAKNLATSFRGDYASTDKVYIYD